MLIEGAAFQAILCFPGTVLGVSDPPLAVFPVQIKFYCRHLVCPGRGFSHCGAMLRCGCCAEKIPCFSGSLCTLWPHRLALRLKHGLVLVLPLRVPQALQLPPAPGSAGRGCSQVMMVLLLAAHRKVVSPGIHAEILTPECDCIWRWGLPRSN